MKMKKFLSILLVVSMLSAVLAGCGSKASSSKNKEKSEVEKVIEQAEKMSLEELYKKAIEESKGKTMYGIGNSSRGATAATSFIEELKKIYDGNI